MSEEIFNEIIEETAELLRRAAHPRKGTVSLSPETAALLERIDSGPAGASPPRRDTM